MADDLTFPLLVAAAALTRADGRVLLQRRPVGTALAGLWEFPGGKREPGEALAATLVRELREELAVTVAPADCVPVAFAAGPHGGRELVLLLYRIERWTGEPRALAADALTWATPAAMAALPMPPLDVPLVAALARAERRAG